jgi:hypothetical protein
MVLFQLVHRQHLPLTIQSNPVNPLHGLDHSSKPDFPRPNSSKNQHHQLSLAAAEDKTRLDKTLMGTVKD